MFARRGRTSIRALAAVVLVVVGSLGTVGNPKAASATLLGECVVSGTMSISPGLDVVPQAESFTFSGSAAPCTGVGLTAGPFAGNIFCALEALYECVPFANYNVTSSPNGPCSGGLFHQGLHFKITCQTPVGGVIVSDYIFTSNDGTRLPVTNIVFTGVSEYLFP